MRVLETSGRKISSELQGQDRTQSPSPDDAGESVASSGNTTGDDARPSISFGRGRPVSPFHIANLSATATGSLRSETWPSVSSEALMVSLDEPSESSSSQSSPSPTTSAGPITSSGSGRSGDASRSSSVSEDPAAVQRRYRYIRSRIPVRGHSFCSCLDSPNRTEGRFLECLCGEENGSVCEWTWDAEHKSSAAKIQDDLRTVIFHPNFSNGTAAVRGCAPMREGQHFWEIKMITPVYGTNMMVGVGTKDINLEGYSNVFCSLLGQNTESWGLSYQAHFHHGGQIWQYGGMFGQGSLLGIHLDCWNGTLSFYKNRRPLGVACRNLIGKEVYPMLCSTAARSGMRLVRTQSCTSTLQYLCCRKLRQLIPPHMDVMKEIPLPPGLKTYLSGAYGWLLSSVTEPAKPPQDEKEENNPQATEADLDTGNSNIETTTSYQMLSDRDIIFERFVERLSTPPGRVVPSVQDDAEARTSQQGQGRAGRRRSQSSAPSERVYFEMVPSSSVRSSSTVNPANVSDSEDITDVSVLSSESLAMETGREQVEKSSWMKGSEVPRSEGGACNIEPHNTKVNSSQNSSAGLVQGPYLKRTLRRKRTLADPAEISQAAVHLQEKLDEYDWKSIVTEPPKRQRLEDSKQRNSTSPVSREITQNKAVTFACEKQSASEPSPNTPFSTFCSTSTTTPRPFTPPNGTSTPVTKLSPEDASSSHSSISALNTETFDEEEDTENPKEESDENDTKNDCQL